MEMYLNLLKIFVKIAKYKLNLSAINIGIEHLI